MSQIAKSTLTILSIFLFIGQIIGQNISLVKDIDPEGNGVINSDESYFAAVGDNLFFVGTDGVAGEELWITNGSEGSTRMVKDIYPGQETSDLHGLIEHNGLCYFFADDGVNGKELWSSDGTESGTQMIADINPGSSSAVFSSFEYLTSFDGALYFEAYDGDKDKLWEVDSNNNASLFSGLPSVNFHSGITGIHVMDGSLYFFRKLTFDGLILYKYDGSNLTEIEAFGLGNIITHINNSNGILYYAIQEGFGEIIWAYDSNTDTNKMLLNSSSAVHSSIAHNSDLYYSLDGDPTLYLLNSVSTEPTILSETSFSFADEPTAFEIFKNQVYYFGESSNDGIHRTDGTPNGTELLFDINKVSFDRNGLHAIGDQLLIAGETSYVQGEELFISDGESSIELLSDISIGNQDSEPSGFISLGDSKVFFTATTGNEGRELWLYDEGEVSTSEIQAEQFAVFPSLVSNSIEIKSSTSQNINDVKVSIHNASGIPVISGSLNKTSHIINTSNWVPGIYFVSIGQKGATEVHRVIKI